MNAPRTRIDRVFDSLKARPCFICQKPGRCKHREYEVELALVDAEIRRALRTAPKPAVSVAQLSPIKRTEPSMRETQEKRHA